MNEQEEEFSVIDYAYGYLVCAFELLGDADLFDELCANVSVHYDEFIEEVENEEYADNILGLCLNGK